MAILQSLEMILSGSYITYVFLLIVVFGFFFKLIRGGK